MRLSLFNDSVNLYQAKLVDFKKAIELKQIQSIILKGYRDKGFFIRGKSMIESIELTYVLVNSYSEIMYIKDPERAHAILYAMGIEDFEIDVSEWDMESAFNPHRVSKESRERKKRREEALRFRFTFLNKYRFSYNHIQIEHRIKRLVLYAVEQGWLSEVKEIPNKEFFIWSEGVELPDNITVPTWAMKAALALTVICNHYPLNNLEMASFANLWFSMYGPFETIEEAYNSFPDVFVETVTKAGVSEEWIDIVLRDEILHARKSYTAKVPEVF